ncbi:helix-turn-helix transcriptional regulator [Paenibacillus sp. FSL R10-2791]|uniref:helix-turn-helix domain-containing protein n=1 Tax=unclassified Paenibacillus TaxID=185978 RepID=UPI0030F52A62
MKDTAKLGKKINALRLKNDLSLRDLEKKAKVSYSFISAIENDRYQASRDKIIALADALEGANKDELLLLAGFAPENESVSKKIAENSAIEQAEFEAFITNPEHGIFFKDYLSSPEERKKELMQFWKFIKEAEKDRKPGDRQGE